MRMYFHSSSLKSGRLHREAVAWIIFWDGGVCNIIKDDAWWFKRSSAKLAWGMILLKQHKTAVRSCSPTIVNFVQFPAVRLLKISWIRVLFKHRCKIFQWRRWRYGVGASLLAGSSLTLRGPPWTGDTNSWASSLSPQHSRRVLI